MMKKKLKRLPKSLNKRRLRLMKISTNSRPPLLPLHAKDKDGNGAGVGRAVTSDQEENGRWEEDGELERELE